MLGWFKPKSAPQNLPAVVKRPGFFSTDADISLDRATVIREVHKKTFQRTAKDFVAVAADGSSMGMDDALSSIQDAKFFNSGGEYGYGVPNSQLDWFGQQAFIGFQACAIIAQNWLVEKICAMPARDAVRHGYEITANGAEEIDPKILAWMAKRDKQMNIKKKLVEFGKFNRVFGIRIAMFIIDSPDPHYYSKPFNPDGVTPGSYKGITQIDPYWYAPELSAEDAANPESKNFYDPTWYRINGKRVHRSHLVIIHGSEVADILKPSYLYAGISVPQKIAERVYAAERTANEAPQLAMSKRLTVLHVDISQAMANFAKFCEKMACWVQQISNFGAKIVGEDEKIEQFDTSLTDLVETIESQFALACAAGDCPVTKVMGLTPKGGIGNTGEYDESSYHEFLESMQENEFSPFVERHHICLIRSEVVPRFNVKPFDTEAVWKPVDSPTAAELAATNKIKADTDAVYAAINAIDGYDVRNRLINDKDSGYNGLDPVVPGGPGDRIAEQEAQKAELESKQGFGEDAIDPMADFNPARGILGGAQLITGQRFLDNAIVQEKREAKDFNVDVSPVYYRHDGMAYRIIIDGHHSLKAALLERTMPVFHEMRGDMKNAITGSVA